MLFAFLLCWILCFLNPTFPLVYAHHGFPAWELTWFWFGVFLLVVFVVVIVEIVFTHLKMSLFYLLLE